MATGKTCVHTSHDQPYRSGYQNSFFFLVTSGRIECLQRVKNCAARLITGTKLWDSITRHLKSLHWLPIRLRIYFKVALLCYRVSEQLRPPLPSNLQLYRPNSSVSPRSSSTQKLVVPSSRTKTYGDRAFSVYFAYLWNNLPSTIFSSQSVSIFKNRLKTHLFRIPPFEWKYRKHAYLESCAFDNMFEKSRYEIKFIIIFIIMCFLFSQPFGE
jgi:hypothetical protein